MSEIEPEVVVTAEVGAWRAIASSLAAAKATGNAVPAGLIEAVDRVRSLCNEGSARLTVSVEDARVMMGCVRVSLDSLKILVEVLDDDEAFRARFGEIAGDPGIVPDRVIEQAKELTAASYSDLCRAVSDLRLSAGMLSDRGILAPAVDPEAMQSVLRACVAGFKPCDPECERCDAVKSTMVELLAMVDGNGSEGVVTVSIPMMRVMRQACDRYADIVMDLPPMDRISERRLANLAETLDEFLWRAENLDDDE